LGTFTEENYMEVLSQYRICYMDLHGRKIIKTSVSSNDSEALIEYKRMRKDMSGHTDWKLLKKDKNGKTILLAANEA